MQTFYARCGWTLLETLPSDGSPRTYARVEKGGRRALFMDCGPLEGVSYITRLADFIRIGGWLRDIGLRAPEVYEADERANVAIVEDFGATSMKAAMERGADRKVLYAEAAAILRRIGEAECPLELPDFFASPMRARRVRLADWYVPAVRLSANPEGLRESYARVWDEIERGLPAPQSGFMHVDFHAENLMVLAGGQGLGIIDFQEALRGPLAYDLVNLLEDMRADVPEDIQAALLKDRDEGFLAWYRVLGTQFHMRLMGQCVRWAVADGKPQYMQFLPRLERYIHKALQDPVLKPLKQWCREEGLDFAPLKDFNPESVRPFIADDAI